jgi:riboflavin kinase/FMN adenylyltransferase
MAVRDGDGAARQARPIVAIGNFDGVHRGHQALLDLAASEARRAGSSWGVLTFEPHPRTFFRPAEPVFRLSPAPLKERLIEALGADFVATLAFDRDLSALEPEEFVRRKLVEALAPSKVIMGYDFHFGHGRKGSPETMRRLGGPMGFEVVVVDQVTDEDGLAPFSSSTIRDELRHGRVVEAGDGLGYRWMVTGTVVEGDHRGRTLGFPTANIVLEPGMEPKEGIYSVRLRLAGRPAEGVAYIGERPTFSTGRRFLEVHVFDFDGDIYGETLDVVFAGFVRPDMKFSSAEALVARMGEDRAVAMRQLAEIAVADPVLRFPLGRLQAEGRL